MNSAAAAIRRAVIIAIGSELLSPTKVDTNSLFLTEQLDGLGVAVAYKVVVGDDEAAVSRFVLRARDEDDADLIVLTGGLGATADDVTRSAVSRALELPMREKAELVTGIRARFEARGLTMPELNLRQALVPRGADVLPNPRGTAPGLWIRTETCVCVLLPGPPRELQRMFTDQVHPRIAPLTGGMRVYRMVLTIVGQTESRVEELTKSIYTRWCEPGREITTTILGRLGQIELHLTTIDTHDSAGSSDAAARLDRATGEIAEVLRTSLLSTSGESLEFVVGGLLKTHERRVSVAESCTGGLITSRLTDVPGSSTYFKGGWTVYSNQAKIEQLGVSQEVLTRHGAVSKEVACALAERARYLARVDYGLGVTGIAGPGGGTETKPVGTVWLALAGPTETVCSRHVRFLGERELVKFQASQTALDMLRRSLLSEDDAGGSAQS